MADAPRKIGIVTVARSDYGIYRPVMDAIAKDKQLDYGLYVSGAHLSARHGNTISEIEAEGRPVWARIPIFDDGSLGDDSLETASVMGRAVTGFAKAFSENRPDVLLVLGDRYEMFAAASASVPFNIPLAHIHGGEVTYGAIDEVFRHGITKMAHIHFPATEDYAARIRQMGEEGWRITMSGAPSLDNITPEKLLDAEALTKALGLPFSPAPIIITLHSATRGLDETRDMVEAMLRALGEISDIPLIFTAPNADPGGQLIREAISAFVAGRKNAFQIESFGSLYYLSALAQAALVVGNSSSGLIETPSFKLPTVNIGDRQEGRTRAINVIDVPPTYEAISEAIKKGLSPAFRDSLKGLTNPYGDGRAGAKIAKRLSEVALDKRLIAKRFEDI